MRGSSTGLLAVLIVACATTAYPKVGGGQAVPGRLPQTGLLPELPDIRVAQLATCARSGERAPFHGEVLKSTGRQGPHHVLIKNSGSLDAVVQFRQRTVQIQIYLSSGQSIATTSFPSGEYELEFMFGQNWSRSCNQFLINSYAQKFPEIQNFPSITGQYMQAEYIITPVPSGNIRPEGISIDSFSRP
jgi:hypothetical protein